ncbi:hypothetical protein [Aquimarina sp. 2201CG5-10]|uniref:hypothetical protein n=1 Tax=Aquimarina callyspongiae TaxID=3098150 RepID=UPI002AB3755B|nr:hypothetical protein [Aquimarina sp. 2201CG5-10]MDY8135639.1 hypothetical protein [Aquimarina sp. 2201CG5-10]
MNLKQIINYVFVPDAQGTKKVSRFKWYAMKVIYFLTFFSLGKSTWSEIINPSELWGPYDGVTYSFWAAYATLMGLGIRYPLKMLPLLLLQLFYKSVWLIGIYLTLSSSGQVDETSASFFKPFAMAIPIDLIAIPWVYVFKNYIKELFKIKVRLPFSSKGA